MIDIPLNTLPGLEDVPPEQTFPGNEKPVPHTPKKDDNYVFRLDVVRSIIGWLYYAKPDGLLFFGDRGSGKSSGFFQFHAWLNLPLFSVSGHATMEFEDLLGSKEIVDGDTITYDGPLVQAYRTGAPFLFEEIDRAPETVTIAFNSILDGYPLVNTLNGGEVIHPAKGFRVAATGNTAGNGDMSGEYNTANIMDASLLDRFWAIRVDYPSPDEEFAILQKALGDSVPEASVRQSIAFANDIRYLHSGETTGLSSLADASLAPTIETTISTRALLRIWELMLLFQNVEQPLHHALRVAVTNKASKTCAEAIERIAEAHFVSAGP